MDLPPKWIALPRKTEITESGDAVVLETLVDAARIYAIKEFDAGVYIGARVALLSHGWMDTTLTVKEVVELINKANHPPGQHGLSTEYTISMSGDYAGYTHNDLDDDNDN